MNSIAEGAEQNAVARANEIPEWNYCNGITSFWGSVSSLPSSSRTGGDNGDPSSDPSGPNDSAPNADDAPASTSKGGKTKRTNAKTPVPPPGREKRPRTTDDRFNSGSESVLQRPSEQHGTRPGFVPAFLPPFPPEHTYGPVGCSSIVLSVPPPSSSPRSASAIGAEGGGGGGVEGPGGAPAFSGTVVGGFGRALDVGGTRSVRESLVTLGRSVGTTFWGSTVPVARRGEGGEGVSAAPSIQVQTSLPGAHQGRNQNNKVVAPLEKASTLKVSRILEGS